MLFLSDILNMGNDTSSQGGFIQRLIESIFGSKDPEALKKKQLKEIAKELSKTHTNYYKFSSDEVEPSLGKLFYQIYKGISNSQQMFQSFQNPAALKNMIITRSLSEPEATNLSLLDEKSIREKSASIPYPQLAEHVNQTLEAFTGAFDVNRITHINSLYTAILSFQSFCTYDYYFLLKKFD